MSSYIPNTGEEQKEMLASLGMTSADELFSVIPKELRASELKLESGKSELEVRRQDRYLQGGIRDRIHALPGRDQPGRFAVHL